MPTATITAAGYSATEQTALTLANTGISIGSANDPADGNAGSMTVTLSVGEGTLTVTAGNSSVTGITGSGTSSVSFSGTVTQINNLLGGVNQGGAEGTVVYTATSDNPSASTILTLLVNDNGNTGTGGALTASDTATINIAAVNDAPTVTTVSATETQLNFTISDPDSTSFVLANSPVAFATAFGNPTLSLGANAISPTQQTTALSGTLQISDGAGGTASVIGLYLGTGAGNTASAPIAGSPNAMYGFGGNDTLTGGTAGDVFFGGANNDTLTGGGGIDTFNVTQGTDTILDVGVGGADNIVVSAGAVANVTAGAAWTATAATSNSGTATVEANGFSVNVAAATGANGWTLTNNSSTAVTLTGSANADSLISSTAEDTINAGLGADTVSISTVVADYSWTVNLGSDLVTDKIVFTHNSIDSGNDTVATVSNFNVAHDKVAVTLGGTAIADGTFQTLTSDGTAISAEVVELAISTRVTASLGNDGDNSTIENIIANATNNFTSGTGTYTFIIYSDTTPTANAGIYSVNISDSTNPSTGGMTVEHIMTLNNVGFGNLGDANFVATADPLIFDLGAPGLELVSSENGVQFDINGDGLADQMAWTAGEDGILALDANGNGTIDNGTEVFSPFFAGGEHAGSLAALATLDSNGDGAIDGGDAAFGDLRVWQDFNHDGVSDAGELSSLTDPHRVHRPRRCVRRRRDRRPGTACRRFVHLCGRHQRDLCRSRPRHDVRCGRSHHTDRRDRRRRRTDRRRRQRHPGRRHRRRHTDRRRREQHVRLRQRRWPAGR